METILLVIHISVALLLVGIVLIQRSSSDGLGGIGGGGGGQNILSSRGSANLLTRTTSILAAIFMINSLILAVIASHNSAPNSVLDGLTDLKPVISSEVPEEEIPTVPIEE